MTLECEGVEDIVLESCGSRGVYSCIWRLRGDACTISRIL